MMEEFHPIKVSFAEETLFSLQSFFAPITIPLKIIEGKSLVDAFKETINRETFIKNRRQKTEENNSKKFLGLSE